MVVIKTEFKTDFYKFPTSSQRGGVPRKLTECDFVWLTDTGFIHGIIEDKKGCILRIYKALDEIEERTNIWKMSVGLEFKQEMKFRSIDELNEQFALLNHHWEEYAGMSDDERAEKFKRRINDMKEDSLANWRSLLEGVEGVRDNAFRNILYQSESLSAIEYQNMIRLWPSAYVGISVRYVDAKAKGIVPPFPVNPSLKYRRAEKSTVTSIYFYFLLGLIPILFSWSWIFTLILWSLAIFQIYALGETKKVHKVCEDNNMGVDELTKLIKEKKSE
tara:strand:+ start:1727 stop:2551 length:825 start_codon:yes stop_codon:yes gene_type:complete